MKVNKDLDVQDFFTPNQSLNSLNTYQESFPRKDNLHKNWMQVRTGFFRRTIWLCWHVGHSRTLSPAGLCSPPPCDLKEIKPTKQLTPLAKKMLWSLTTNYKKHGDSITIDTKLQKQTWFFVADYGICIVGNLSWKINLSKKTPMASISLSFCALACQNIMTLVKIVMIAWYDWTFRFSRAGCGCAETEKERVHHWSIPSSHVALLQELGLLFSSHHSQLSCHSPSAPANQASRAHV